MSNKGIKIFVCSSIYNEKLISKIVPASSQEEAGTTFFDQYMISAQEILGPFYHCNPEKRILKNTKILKFSDNKPHKAIYNEWLVNAFLLSEPIDHAYLVFINSMHDNKNFPKGTIVVPVYDLRFIKDE